MQAPPQPPEPLMTISVCARPGAKPRDVLVDEGSCEELQRQIAIALQGIRAAKQAMLAMLAPRPPAAPAEAMAFCTARHPVSSTPCELDDGHPGTHMYTAGAGAEVEWPATPYPAAVTEAALAAAEADPTVVPEKCGARPYPAGSEGDDGTECVLPKGHDGDHDDGIRADQSADDGELPARVGVPEQMPVPASHYCDAPDDCDQCGGGRLATVSPIHGEAYIALRSESLAGATSW